MALTTRAVALEKISSQGWLATWLDLDSDDDGRAVSFPGRVLGLTVQLGGTLGTGGALKIQASNDGTNWADLPTAVAFTTLGIKSVAAIDCHYRYYKPVATGGDGTTLLDVFMFARTGE